MKPATTAQQPDAGDFGRAIGRAVTGVTIASTEGASGRGAGRVYAARSINAPLHLSF
ncbi:hypothetical protein [Specibacter cremeus]|uniref:hypothetical protein n=1 Tax=Specibacter cremeus TaxID=1629051 RepID=UPI0013DE6F2A|nr:hypothetical protein [Specibacter cremeus]